MRAVPSLVSHHCRRCDESFESDEHEPRCPRCLRKSTVVRGALGDGHGTTSGASSASPYGDEPPVAVFRYVGLRGTMLLGVLAATAITAVAVVSLAVGIRGLLTVGLLMFGVASLAGCGHLLREWLRDPPSLVVYEDRVVVPVGVGRTRRVVPFSQIARMSPPIDLGTRAGRVLTLDLVHDDRIVVALGDYAEPARIVYEVLVDAHDGWRRRA